MKILGSLQSLSISKEKEEKKRVQKPYIFVILEVDFVFITKKFLFLFL